MALAMLLLMACMRLHHFSLKYIYQFTLRFPRPIPYGTAVPAWAYMDIQKQNVFNISAAIEIASAGELDSTPLAASVSTPSISAGATSSISARETLSISASITSLIAPSTPSFDTPTVTVTAAAKSSNRNVADIVGGAVGGFIGLAIMSGIALQISRRNRNSPEGAESCVIPETATLPSSLRLYVRFSLSVHFCAACNSGI